LAGVAWSTLHRVESGRVSPTVALLEKLAAALDIGIRDFFPSPGRGHRTTRRKA
jgi:transcriptional regulator with XRE-family HTH domain